MNDDSKCECDTCETSENPCHGDCDYDMQCIGCHERREAIEDIKFEIWSA